MVSVGSFWGGTSKAKRAQDVKPPLKSPCEESDRSIERTGGRLVEESIRNGFKCLAPRPRCQLSSQSMSNRFGQWY
ncbi:hypothetical protein ZHAS_00003154 [Anopheles sinensis]|uniref:Uncharacterized protein n=1 Tax=Anopheles sinensis TaxID=74873 RepID=A0A084VDR6_ANOSI|nr:hypothetical protein ZHAS_00003154 [Anopheles sinensis]